MTVCGLISFHCKAVSEFNTHFINFM